MRKGIATIGVDVGGSKTLFALLDGEMRPVEETKVKTAGDDKPEFSNALLDSVNTLLKKAAKRKLVVSAIGIGCAGSIENKVVKISPNVPALKDYSFESVLRKVSATPVHVYNDVNAGLYGELKHGAALGYKHVIGIFIGTGVGAAIVINGKLYVGASGNAGDIGQFLIHPFGLVTGFAPLGVLDSISSRTAIAGDAAALAAKHRAPHLLELAGTDVRSIKSGTLAKAIRLGDKSIEELVRSRAQILGIALSSVIHFLDPEMIVLGGGLATAMPVLIRQEVAVGIKAHASPGGIGALRIVTSKLKDHAVTIGAAQLALDVG
jgi:glucokinase